MFSKYQYSVFLIVSLFSSVALAQSNVINDGANIIIADGVNVIIANDLTTNAGGSVDNQGSLLVGGDFVNNSGGDLFTADAGSVELNGNVDQSIGGNDTSRFNVLNFSGTSNKLLDTDTDVADTLNLNDNTLLLQSNTLSVLSSTPASITANTGGIVSESTDAAGIVSQSIGTATGTFNIPFVTAVGTPITLTANIGTAGTGTGAINFATYPTAVDNLPLPAVATNLDILDAVTADADVAVNRFWVADSAGFGTPPSYTLTLTPDNANDLAFSGGALDGNLSAVQFIGGDWLDGNGGFVSAGNNADVVITTAGITPIAITGINDEPSFELTQTAIAAGNDTGPQSIDAFADNIDLGALDDIEQEAAFAITVNDPDLFSVLPSIDSDGNLNFTPSGSAAGSDPAEVTVVLNDGGGVEFGGIDASVAQTFTIIFDFVQVPALSNFGLAILMLLFAFASILVHRRNHQHS